MKKIYNLENINFLEIANSLNSGELIIYPTDTVYGIGGVISSEETIKSIYKAKERSFKSPLIVLISDVKKIEEIAYISEENRKIVERLIAKFWPGGLTIILRKKEWIPNVMTAFGDTVGIRMPALDVALKIIESAGGMLPTTSANISGEKTPRAYDELSEVFKGKVDILVDGGKSPLGIESTIIDLSDEPRIIRLGAISIKDIEKVIGKSIGRNL
ncbi:tRNA(ANN) t(6)A37 threonylcarbamoyladenosine modification protein [Fusobacterium necrogenes]|uniref:L-threonylcarbamoyladenylate synthase n=1 Tax=Fusobacterium necrogenes TaxID=858 RepID=A0A377GYP8_9FUSO|nr:L-threonylcarbamoyladenylate synthase [Fusobacterium necrogenes]STO31993.1 tRNA(ANN) t(6)A37 threonylcarbamoyladenosine modification protein [Fusobacterium necrogenes]